MKKLMILPLMLTLTSLACLVSDARDTLKTIDKAVNLLQEIEESGTWELVDTGLKGLTDQTGGYAATLTFAEGSTDTTGENLTEVTNQLTWDVSVDGDQDTALTITRDDTTTRYLIFDEEVYRLEGDVYNCVDENLDENDVFATNVEDAFVQYSALALGVQTLSVAEEDGTATINRIESKRYKLVSKLREALDILKEFPNDELRQSIENIPEFYINGSVNVDVETGSLVRFDSQYANLDDQVGNTFTFEATELGNQADITKPEGSLLGTACQVN